jgi:prephenate dehydrogenase
MEGGAHDSAVAALSHLPQLAAVALMRMAGKHRVASKYLALGAGGFRDMTRIASSPFGFWGDILESNRAEIRRALRLYQKELARVERTLRRAPRRLSAAFSDARRLRAGIPSGMKGFLHTLTDIQVFVEDRPGALLKVLRSLAAAKVNLKDIELVKVREGMGGTFRLWFESPTDARKAKEVVGRR